MGSLWPTHDSNPQTGGWVEYAGKWDWDFFSFFFYNKTEADEINESVKIKLQSRRLCWESLQFSIEIRVEFMWIALWMEHYVIGSSKVLTFREIIQLETVYRSKEDWLYNSWEFSKQFPSFQDLKELYKKRLITYYFMPSNFGSSCMAKDTFKDYDRWWLTYSNCNAALRIPKWGFKQALSTTFGHEKLVSRACFGLHVECISISEESLHFRMSRTFFLSDFVASK